MKKTRLHRRLKAPAGAYSDRYGPRLARDHGKSEIASREGDPWLKDFPRTGIAVATLPLSGIAIRRS